MFIIGHSAVVRRQRSCVSSSGNSTASPRPRSQLSLPPSTKTRLHTTQPGRLTPLIEPPPLGKYIAGWRSLLAPAKPPTRCAGGTLQETSKTHPKSSIPWPLYQRPQRTSCNVVSGVKPNFFHRPLVISASRPAHSSTSLKWGSASPAYKSCPLFSAFTGGRSTLLSRPSARSEAGVRSLSPC